MSRGSLADRGLPNVGARKRETGIARFTLAGLGWGIAGDAHNMACLDIISAFVGLRRRLGSNDDAAGRQ
jgi:hypothetical protein